MKHSCKHDPSLVFEPGNFGVEAIDGDWNHVRVSTPMLEFLYEHRMYSFQEFLEKAICFPEDFLNFSRWDLVNMRTALFRLAMDMNRSSDSCDAEFFSLFLSQEEFEQSLLGRGMSLDVQEWMDRYPATVILEIFSGEMSITCESFTGRNLLGLTHEETDKRLEGYCYCLHGHIRPLVVAWGAMTSKLEPGFYERQLGDYTCMLLVCDQVQEGFFDQFR